jgi:hypothetical protein
MQLPSYSVFVRFSAVQAFMAFVDCRRLVKYFNGEFSVEDMMLLEGLARAEVLGVLLDFSRVLVQTVF